MARSLEISMFGRSWQAAFYRNQSELFGDSSVYDMEVFQEGGDSGDVPVAEAARNVQKRAQPLLILMPAG
jgi:hypothetical protein